MSGGLELKQTRLLLSSKLPVKLSSRKMTLWTICEGEKTRDDQFFLFILHIILACSEQATYSLNNVTSDPSEYIFGASSGGIGTSRKIVGNWSFEARFLFDISVMMATMADGLKERENLYKLMIR